MSEVVTVKESRGALVIERSAGGRARAGAWRALVTMPLALGALGVVLLPDYIGRYREAEPVPGLFWGALAAVALLVGGLVGLVGALRRERWVVDGPGRELRVEVSLMASTQGAGVPLVEVKGVELVPGGVLRPGRLDVVLTDERRETLARGYFLTKRLRDVGEEVVTYLREHRFVVALRQAGGGAERA
ncbi:hypothetical protein DL240_00155 [Lujinxingia litoralis]|uniref:Uncharacterized protein n=1 Tax=Lujinxingia litoralis TaxID=2211119 RepID=A0A328C7W4_9DELT|nr:hypothetical protein [Lujinxingia litoralis]RAL24657.1 hypothetical protein DL240_00155 [Lujinxingia litoralis]